MKPFEIAIVGGGASGLMAAVSAAEELKLRKKSGTVVILEGNKKLGKKLLVTGNGRCNLTNMTLSPECYCGDRDFLAPLLASCTASDVRNLFQRMGLLTKPDEEGRVYPLNLQAAAVLEVLKNRAEDLGVDCRVEFTVASVTRKDKGFVIKSEIGEELQAKKCILASGGMASPKHLASQKGYEICKSLGHSVTALYPALVQITSKDKFLKNLAGVRARADISLRADGKLQRKEKGELLFADKALSGICIFQLSLLASEFFYTGMLNGKKYRKLTVGVDFLPDYREEEILSFLTDLKRREPKQRTGEFLNGVVNMKLGREIVRACGLNFEQPVSSLHDRMLAEIARRLKNTEIDVSGVRGFEDAQITAGGIPMKEIWPERMESKKVPGLYLCGELLNIHGKCGGYNLHFAWLSGKIAGQSAARKEIVQ